MTTEEIMSPTKDSVRRKVNYCPSCGNTAPQRIVYEHRYETTWYSPDDKPHREGPDLLAILCICESCNAPVLYDGIDPREVDTDWPEQVYPEPRDVAREVPWSVRQIYQQAARCKDNSPMAFAVLIRKALEAICDERGIPRPKGRRGDLFHRLQQLASDGHVPPTLAKMTDVLRTLGNTAAHEPVSEVTVPMTWSIDAFFRAIVEYVYVAPAKIAKFEERMKKKQGDGRDG